MSTELTCRTTGVQIPGADVFHHPDCGHVRGNRWLRPPKEGAVIAMCCLGRWLNPTPSDPRAALDATEGGAS